MNDPYASPLLERIIPGRNLSKDIPVEKRTVLKTFEPVQWVSPSNIMRKRHKEDVLLEEPCLGLPLDGQKSMFSLDYGLVSPKKVWTSPPQRIAKSQNLEWTSPHRIIDRPNPEDSPGNWVPVRETHQTVRKDMACGKFRKISD